ncbi:hypothetical protein FOL47_011321 [Perkinsus chesapeaki]|uniref:Peptidase A1 domain-containing protein n=1 Tax=Perkinsus chesapeaki TaxID=330153 RepID=A0A7J6MNK8_PERCH|nr:hypothetical protein FOL47_011321 [Perkinsus chesapeaki]
MRTTTIGICFASLQLHVHGQLSLPFDDGIVTGVSLDSEPLKMFMDTGLSGTFVVYKDWYEEVYGKGSCKTFEPGCYSCPEKCDPYDKERDVRTFSDGSEITSVLHQGTASIGKSQMTMTFRLIIGFSPGDRIPNGKPKNFLGLGFPTGPSPETVPRQLFRNGLIKQYAVTICSPGHVLSFKGTLIFGDWKGLCKVKPTLTTIPMTEPHKWAFFDSVLSSFGLISSTGHIFTRETPQRSLVYDTGAYSVALPKAIFETVLNQIVTFTSADNGSDVYVKTSRNTWFIEEKGLDFLPVLTFSVGD